MTVKRCTASFVVWPDGRPRVITAGMLVDDTDPVYKGHEANFEDVEAAVARAERPRSVSAVEQATAEPGERRSVRASARRRTKPDDSEG